MIHLIDGMPAVQITRLDGRTEFVGIFPDEKLSLERVSARILAQTGAVARFVEAPRLPRIERCFSAVAEAAIAAAHADREELLPPARHVDLIDAIRANDDEGLRKHWGTMNVPFPIDNMENDLHETVWWTALNVAAVLQRFDMMKFLVSRGAAVDGVESPTGVRSAGGYRSYIGGLRARVAATRQLYASGRALPAVSGHGPDPSQLAFLRGQGVDAVVLEALIHLKKTLRLSGVLQRLFSQPGDVFQAIVRFWISGRRRRFAASAASAAAPSDAPAAVTPVAPRPARPRSRSRPRRSTRSSASRRRRRAAADAQRPRRLGAASASPSRCAPSAAPGASSTRATTPRPCSRASTRRRSTTDPRQAAHAAGAFEARYPGEAVRPSKKAKQAHGGGGRCKPVEVRAVGGAWRLFASRSEAAAAFEGLDSPAIIYLIQGKPTHAAGKFEARNPGEAVRPSKQPAVSLKNRELLFCRKGCGRSFDWPAARGNHEKHCKAADPEGGVAMPARARRPPRARRCGGSCHGRAGLIGPAPPGWRCPLDAGGDAARLSVFPDEDALFHARRARAAAAAVGGGREATTSLRARNDAAVAALPAAERDRFGALFVNGNNWPCVIMDPRIPLATAAVAAFADKGPPTYDLVLYVGERAHWAFGSERRDRLRPFAPGLPPKKRLVAPATSARRRGAGPRIVEGAVTGAAIDDDDDFEARAAEAPVLAPTPRLGPESDDENSSLASDDDYSIESGDDDDEVLALVAALPQAGRDRFGALVYVKSQRWPALVVDPAPPDGRRSALILDLVRANPPPGHDLVRYLHEAESTGYDVVPRDGSAPWPPDAAASARLDASWSKNKIYKRFLAARSRADALAALPTNGERVDALRALGGFGAVLCPICFDEAPADSALDCQHRITGAPRRLAAVSGHGQTRLSATVRCPLCRAKSRAPTSS
ncbi:hypothetical protein JL721_4133 [Aureococcus anophagefferens]|nr:hypothetical protein JL721_4133 [Aureococcus anophagefferens]